MLTLDELSAQLTRANARFEIISHPSPIFTVKDAAKIFDITKAAPVFILSTGKGFTALIASAGHGRIDFTALGQRLGHSWFKMATPDEVIAATGYPAGSIPLIGHGLPCLFDRQLLNHDFIYGGTGKPCHTLKIAPEDVVRLNPGATLTGIN